MSWFRSIRSAVVVGLVAVWLSVGWIPGMVVLIVALIAALVRVVRVLRARRAVVFCSAGHEVRVFDVWTCPRCGFTADGWGWRCGNCGALAAHLRCEECGRSVRSPLT